MSRLIKIGLLMVQKKLWVSSRNIESAWKIVDAPNHLQPNEPVYLISFRFDI